MGKGKAPKPTASELELQRNQRRELNQLTTDRNSQLKAIKRTLGGRRSLLGSGSEVGIRSAGAAGGRAGGIMSSGGAAASGTARTGWVSTPSTPSRQTAR